MSKKKILLIDDEEDFSTLLKLNIDNTTGYEALVAQRLVRVICTNCKEEAPPDPVLIRRLGLQAKEGELKVFQGIRVPSFVRNAVSSPAGVPPF